MKPLRVLIISAERIGSILVEKLKALGYLADLASTLEATFSVLRTVPPDIAVVSQAIAGGTGVWLAERVSASHPQMGVILWTSGPLFKEPQHVHIVCDKPSLTAILAEVGRAATRLPSVPVPEPANRAHEQAAQLTKMAKTRPARETLREVAPRTAAIRALSCPVPSNCPNCYEPVIDAHFAIDHWQASYRCTAQVKIGSDGRATWSLEVHEPKPRRAHA